MTVFGNHLVTSAAEPTLPMIPTCLLNIPVALQEEAFDPYLSVQCCLEELTTDHKILSQNLWEQTFTLVWASTLYREG